MIAPHFQFSLNGSHGGAVPLLPRCVPDLQICLLAIHQHPLHLEINPWGKKEKKSRFISLSPSECQCLIKRYVCHGTHPVLSEYHL